MKTNSILNQVVLAPVYGFAIISFLLIGCNNSLKSNRLPDSNQGTNVGATGLKVPITWKTRLPLLWQMAYAGTVEPDPATITYNQFLSDVATKLKADATFISATKGVKGDIGPQGPIGPQGAQGPNGVFNIADIPDGSIQTKHLASDLLIFDKIHTSNRTSSIQLYNITADSGVDYSPYTGWSVKANSTGTFFVNLRAENAILFTGSATTLCNGDHSSCSLTTFNVQVDFPGTDIRIYKSINSVYDTDITASCYNQNLSAGQVVCSGLTLGTGIKIVVTNPLQNALPVRGFSLKYWGY